MEQQELIFVGAWGADIQGVNNPESGEGGIKVYLKNSGSAVTFNSKTTPEINVGSMSVTKDGRNIYATDERKDLGGIHGNGGGIVAYEVTDDGQLIFLNEVSSAGAYPCYITSDTKRRYVFTANHGNHEEVITKSVKTADGTFIAKRFFDEGSIAMFPILPDGQIGECCELIALEGESVLPLFQWTSHPHSVVLDPSEKYLLCGDKGCDLIRVFEIDYVNGKLISVWTLETEKGSGPRHIVFHPTLPVFYCNSEQNNTIHAYSFDNKDGSIHHLDRAVTVADNYQAKDDPSDIFAHNQTADIKTHKSGKYLYVSNRGDDSIAIYQIDQVGKIELIEIMSSGGEIPRAINFDSSGDNLYVVNQRTGNIAVFKIDEETGKIVDTGEGFEINNPVAIQFK
ncbi:lactonase family protein [Listeria monocytogenes]|uniref:lactonase family protein n=1 Tax=Listeria monocytogenes TaxID=1639 RepID=UPI0037335829